ncbi:MAG: hypothetical protein AAGI50_09600 [Pseudomonadota bacterium]
MEFAPPGRPASPLNRAGKTGEPACAELFGEALDLSRNRRRGLALDRADRRDIDRPKRERDSRDEKRGVERGLPKRRRLPELSQLHGAAVSM